jgi:hypothetical protein
MEQEPLINCTHNPAQPLTLTLTLRAFSLSHFLHSNVLPILDVRPSSVITRGRSCRWIVPHMLGVAANQIGHPMLFFILMESGYCLLHFDLTHKPFFGKSPAKAHYSATVILRTFSPTRSNAISTSRSRTKRGNFSPHSISRMLSLPRRSSSASVSNSRCVSMR